MTLENNLERIANALETLVAQNRGGDQGYDTLSTTGVSPYPEPDAEDLADPDEAVDTQPQPAESKQKKSTSKKKDTKKTTKKQKAEGEADNGGGVTYEQLVEQAKEFLKTKGAPALRELLEEHGVSALRELDETHYSDIYGKLEA